ncbi:MAG: hypothetical protein GY835_17085 [bacterium]|nr:hypothetical protein [bacterium]
MEKMWVFKCQRCGCDYQEVYDPKAALRERSCPQCRSNSVRPLHDVDSTKRQAKG